MVLALPADRMRSVTFPPTLAATSSTEINTGCIKGAHVYSLFFSFLFFHAKMDYPVEGSFS